jgi:hypothetical protein
VSGNIFLIQHDGQLVPMTEQPYDSEDLLQRLLAEYPDILAGDQMNRAAPRQWLLVAREVAVPDEEGGAGRWSLEHLFLDQDAIPTLVEVKRSTDTRIRREVVGQLLDYAANAVVYWPPAAIRAQFEASCARMGRDAEAVLQTFLGTDSDAEGFWQECTRNLQAGRVRLVFVADQIPVELQRIVEFLNAQMNPAEVLAVEVRQYAGQALRTLVPRVVGQTAAAQQRKEAPSRSTRTWDEASFLGDLELRQGRDVVAVARALLAWATQAQLRTVWGRGNQDGSFFPMLDHGGGGGRLFSVWTYGRVEVQFQYLQATPPFESEALRLELRERLNAIPGVVIPPDGIARRPSLPLATLIDAASLARFLQTFDWVLAQVREDEP